jgi:hypothetical protein
MINYLRPSHPNYFICQAGIKTSEVLELL